MQCLPVVITFLYDSTCFLTLCVYYFAFMVLYLSSKFLSSLFALVPLVLSVYYTENKYSYSCPLFMSY